MNPLCARCGNEIYDIDDGELEPCPFCMVDMFEMGFEVGYEKGEADEYTYWNDEDEEDEDDDELEDLD